MLHRVPQLPLPSADARYASLTGTTIPAPFPLVREQLRPLMPSVGHPVVTPYQPPVMLQVLPLRPGLQSIKHLMRPPVE